MPNTCCFLAAAQNLAGDDQDEGEQEPKCHARTRAEPTLFDRVAHEQKTTEGQRDTTDIDRPVRSKHLFETTPRRLRKKRWRLDGFGLLSVQHRTFGHTDAIVCPRDPPPTPGLMLQVAPNGRRFALCVAGAAVGGPCTTRNSRFERADLALRDLRGARARQLSGRIRWVRENKDDAS